MLHLDQNHSSLSPPHSKSNLILSNSPRPDQHTLLSWSSPARDDRAFYQPQQDQSQPAQAKPDPVEDSPDNKPRRPSSSLGRPSPANEDNKPPSDPPTSTSPAEATSPASSLTPPPDTTSPAFPSTELPEPQTEAKVDRAEGEGEPTVDGSAEVEKASRASTPLSELSSAPDGEEPPDGERRAGEDGPSVALKEVDVARSGTENAEGRVNGEAKPAMNGHAEALQSHPTSVMGMHAPAVKRESSSDSRALSIGISTPEPTSATSSGSNKLDPKVVTILELNAELLKACMEFQTRGIPMSDPRVQQFATRLQNNLGWLAAAADSKSNHNGHSLPQMQPPAPVDFLSMDRIQALYTELPVLFARELRRQSMSAGPSALSSANAPNGLLKRERPEDSMADIANKRRDTGESKAPTPGPSTPQGISSPSQPAPTQMLPPATPPGSMPPPSLPGHSGSSPSMPPPSTPMGMHTNTNEAQVAVARERARQQHLRQQAMHNQMPEMSGDGMRQASPGSQQGMGMQNTAGPSSLSHNPQAQMAALNSMGTAAMQAMQILQNPSHQMTQHLIQSVPGFQSMQLAQQIQYLQRLQYALQAKQQRQAAQAGQSGSHPMAGMQQASGPQSMIGGNMANGQMGVPNGSPTRMSPTGAQFPMGHTGGGMNSSNPMNGLTSAQQANVASLTPHQRQQLLMMQQQMMRGGNVNQNMMSTQMFNAMQQQQQRMAQQQASSSPHVGSPMLGGPTDGPAFPPALRSNPSVPGIARSTRTPSDHAPSPMTPQLSQMGNQRGMNQLVQGGMGQMGNMNASWQQNPQSNQMAQSQGYGMSPPGSAGGFSGMPGNASSPSRQSQQWTQNGQMGFVGGMGSQIGDAMGLPPGSRQASATPMLQHQLSQNNSPMGDGTGLNDFDIFNWSQ
ncbi:hypothetical protein BDW22DRAFT_1425055 [Trametopsis cervina]|nr:hypothetical protein BDW22DRAFT_1425055 [Trametopsis cervina]